MSSFSERGPIFQRPRTSPELTAFQQLTKLARNFAPTLAFLSIANLVDRPERSISHPEQTHPAASLVEAGLRPEHVEKTEEAITLDYRRHPDEPGETKIIARDVLIDEGSFFPALDEFANHLDTNEGIQAAFDSIVTTQLNQCAQQGIEASEVIRSVEIRSVGYFRTEGEGLRLQQEEALQRAETVRRIASQVLAQHGITAHVSAIDQTEALQNPVDSFGQSLFAFGFSPHGTNAERRREIQTVIHALNTRDENQLYRSLPRLRGQEAQLQELYLDFLGADHRVDVSLEFHYKEIRVQTDFGDEPPPMLAKISEQKPIPTHSVPTAPIAPFAMGALAGLRRKRSSEEETAEEQQKDPDSFDEFIDEYNKATAEAAWFAQGDKIDELQQRRLEQRVRNQQFMNLADAWLDEPLSENLGGTDNDWFKAGEKIAKPYPARSNDPFDLSI